MGLPIEESFGVKLVEFVTKGMNCEGHWVAPFMMEPTSVRPATRIPFKT
jgi:hypothetical protein